MDRCLIRLRALFADIGRSDGVVARTAYAVLSTYGGHQALRHYSALLLYAVGLGTTGATVGSLILWAGIWEGAQYMRDRRAGKPRWALLRDWVLHDGSAYASSGVLSWVVLDALQKAGGELSLLKITLSLLVMAITAVGAALIWGKAPQTKQE